jgi:hypothetical protein
MFRPTFGLCPTHHGPTCWIGALPAYQAFELLVTDKIGKKATAGEQITMTVVVQGAAQSPPGGALSPAEAGVSTVLTQPSSSPGSPGSGTTLPPTTIPGLPGTTVTPRGLSSLFPVVTPSSTPSSAAARSGRRKEEERATATASSLPLDPRLIGGQVAGLAVLAAAITMVVARLSLRTPQPALPSGEAVATALPAPEAPEPETKVDAAASTAQPATSET